ncbi:MAG TPA: hypothetical protein VNT79_02170 [Phycisphaerae bacterium]|nr:hypothetical protein [Phycisphaerae bacterium]
METTTATLTTAPQTGDANEVHEDERPKIIGENVQDMTVLHIAEANVLGAVGNNLRRLYEAACGNSEARNQEDGLGDIRAEFAAQNEVLAIVLTEGEIAALMRLHHSHIVFARADAKIRLENARKKLKARQ